ncbi:hypothetical protein Ahy_A06g030729 isoform A [Arachis hypogaea]|uniref:RING-type E3 ubiquitin transferase n=1 Tax=Arachis hypogaea TaxID=3818 RepID=A0A445CX32_ARAHY|nr:hypothetical protein Ahy_A06g030729 isoform A [Arachis hypogaea]
MKFGCLFTEYLQEERELLDEKCAHIEYVRLKKVLKSCQTCKPLHSSSSSSSPSLVSDLPNHQLCQCQSCPVCDQKFFSELMKEASDIVGFFGSRVKHLLDLHVASGMQRYVLRLRQCFKNDRQALAQEGRILIEYIAMNAIAMRKILKKYDKVHSSVNGKNFKSKMHTEHIELLHTPWLIELGAFYLNSSGRDCCELNGVYGHFKCDLNVSDAVMTLILPDSIKLEYNLTCAICLDLVFNPYALGCGHIFCKSCACSAASVMMFQGLKAASPESKCPICREDGVYPKKVRMLELGLLMKRRYQSVSWSHFISYVNIAITITRKFPRYNDYWKERLLSERNNMVKQSKEYWNMHNHNSLTL